MNLVEEFKEESSRVIEVLKSELKGIRANRPSVALIEDIKVDYYGSPTPLNHISSIRVVPPREIHIQVWDQKAVKKVAEAIEGSGLGLSANIEGNVIRLFLPELSEERREELIRHVRKITEEFRIQIRNLRDEVNKKIDKLFDNKEISEDDKFRFKEDIQKETEKANKEIEETLRLKEKDIKT